MKTLQPYPFIHQLFHGKVEKKIFFLHIPKCGGTSIDHAIIASFGLPKIEYEKSFFHLSASGSAKVSEITGEPLMSYREKLLLYYLSVPSYKYVTGHFAYSERAIQEFGKEWNFITILRHPVSKWFSQFFYLKHKKSSYDRIDSDPESFLELESERAMSMGSDYVCRLAEGISLREASSNEAINKVIENLNKFVLVGVLERSDVFARDYKSIFGADLYIKRHNANPLPETKQKEQVTDQIRKKVEEICHPNLRVYEAVLARLSSRSNREIVTMQYHRSFTS
jgi:hypothetical protein